MGSPSIHQRDIDTAVVRKSSSEAGVIVRIGNSKWTVPTASVIAAALAGLGAAWGYVRSERDDLRAADHALACKIEAVEAQSAQAQIVLAQIQTSLVDLKSGQQRLDARVAEVQVTLMQAARR